MTLAEIQMLADFRVRYRSLTWEQLGLLFDVTGTEAREQWLDHTETGAITPAWWREARALHVEGLGVRAIGRALGRDKMAAKYALREMGVRA